MSGLDVSKLTPKQEQAILALLNRPSIKQAAEEVGISERQVYRWLGEDAFGRAYRGARRKAFAHAVSISQQYAPSAVATLAKVMTDPQAPHTAKVSAATALLKFSRESIELDDVVERVAALETAAEQAKAREAA
jgi:hypothetical protein